MPVAGLRCLEIGPGDCPLEGGWDVVDAVHPPEWWQRTDAFKNGAKYFKLRWGFEPLPMPDASYDLVFASHVIEHVPWYQTIDALKEVYRILAEDGDLEVWTLDFAVIVDAYKRKEWVRDWDCAGRITNYMHSIAGHVFAYEKHGNHYNWHKALFDEEYLTLCLREAGFGKIERLTKSRGHDHGPANMGFRATKATAS